MGFSVVVIVIPNAKRSFCKMDKSGRLKCYLKNQPKKGLANKELIALIAKSIGIPRDMVRITHGLTASKKRIYIDLCISLQQFLQALGVDWRVDMFS